MSDSQMMPADSGKLRLVGAACPACGLVSFPPEPICAVCGSRETPSEAQIGPVGRLYTFTVVHAAGGDRPAPYAVGYVDFENGARLFGEIRPATDLKIGMQLRIVGAESGKSGPEAFWYEPLGEDGELG